MLVTHAVCCTCCFLYYLHCRLYKIILTCYLLYYFTFDIPFTKKPFNKINTLQHKSKTRKYVINKRNSNTLC